MTKITTPSGKVLDVPSAELPISISFDKTGHMATVKDNGYEIGTICQYSEGDFHAYPSVGEPTGLNDTFEIAVHYICEEHEQELMSIPGRLSAAEHEVQRLRKLMTKFKLTYEGV